jgi:hypothetical protein
MNTQRRDGRKKNSAGGGKTAPSIFYRQIRPQPYQPRKPRTLASPDRAAPSIRMKGDSKSTSIAQPFHKKKTKKNKRSMASDYHCTNKRHMWNQQN